MLLYRCDIAPVWVTVCLSAVWVCACFCLTAVLPPLSACLLKVHVCVWPHQNVEPIYLLAQHHDQIHISTVAQLCDKVTTECSLLSKKGHNCEHVNYRAACD